MTEKYNGIIYVAKCRSFYKIGATRKVPRLRIENINSSNPYEVKFVCSWKLTNWPKSIFFYEKILHDYFFHSRIGNKEWFKLKKSDIDMIPDLLEQIKINEISKK